MRERVQEYYGKVLERTSDLKTSACCTPDKPPAEISAALAQIHPEVVDRYYGCGLVLPEALEGCRVLDLGCGAGRDCYLLAQLVGPSGYVVGVDMTPEQLAVANRHIDFHRECFGYPASNVEFREGYIEELGELGLEPASFDVIVSNCVINLSPDKLAVLRGAFELLKPGGELYFADVYADRRVPESVASNPELYGECLGGALYWNDFLTLAERAGFLDPRLVTDRPIEISEPSLVPLLGELKFFSATYRLFKLGNLEPACEDYGQSVLYKGTIPGCEREFVLDKHHRIARDEPFDVCGNTYEMLNKTRLAAHFDFVGDRGLHRGIFPGCGTSLPFAANGDASGGGCC